MNAVNIRSGQELKDWLQDKPKDWAQVIAVRAALRALPFLAAADDAWLSKYGLLTIRACGISWSARNFPNHDMRAAADAAYSATYAATTADSVDAVMAPADLAAYAAADAAIAADGADAADAAADAAATASDTAYAAAVWQSIETDCDWLVDEDNAGSAARRLTHRRLWSGTVPEVWMKRWLEQWHKLSSRLLAIDLNYAVWAEWFERRIHGENAAFNIPGDKGRVEDKKILRRLAEATDEDFWGKGHEYVNATLKGWLDDARARVAPPPIVGEASGAFEITGSATAELGPLPTPPQEASAIAYGVNEQGKLDRLPNSDQVHLSDVPDQRRAYSDLRDAAAELLAEGQRLGHRLQRALDRFLHSLPERFEDAEAYLVWRDANALRRLHRAHREASKSPEPDEARLEPVIAEGLGGLLDLYNNFAFADDGLRAKDEARIAPQERASAEAEAKAAIPLVEAILANPEIATPDALDDILAEVENAELPPDDPYSAQVLQQSNETRKNFLAAALAWGATTLASPKQVGKAVAIGSVTGAASVVGKVAMTAVIGTDYGPLLPFIAANAEILQHYVAIAFPSFEHLHSLIDQLKLLWAKRRH